MDSDEPNDIYQDVAELTTQKLKKILNDAQDAAVSYQRTQLTMCEKLVPKTVFQPDANNATAMTARERR